MSCFSDLYKKIADKDKFKTWLLSFLDQIIKCESIPIDINQVLSEVGLLTLAANDTSVFVSQLNDNINLILFGV